MALARIITRSAEEARGLAAQLHARGYEVEIVAPDQASNTGADLEIRLEEANINDALSRAGLPGERDLCVFIAPGAIAGVPSPEIPLRNAANAGREAAPDNVASFPGMNAAHAHADASNEVRAENIGRERSRANPFPPEQPAEPEVYVYQDARLSPLERLRLPHLRLPKLRLPRLRVLKLSLPFLSWHLPRMRVPRPGISFHVPRVRLHIPKPALRLPHFSWPHLALRIPRIKIRMPRLSFRVPTLLVRVPRITWRMPRIALPKFSSLPARRPSSSAPTSISPKAGRLRDRRGHVLFWDSAIALGILAVSALMVGGLLHSRTPLPPSFTQQPENSAQQVPFAKVKPVLPSAPSRVDAIADETPKAAAVAAPELAAQKKPSAQFAQRATRREHQAAKSRPRSSGQMKLAQRSRSSEADSDFVAEDTVVHYGKNN